MLLKMMRQTGLRGVLSGPKSCGECLLICFCYFTSFMIQERIWKRLHILATTYISDSFGNLFIDLRFQVLSIHCTSCFSGSASIIFSDYFFMVDWTQMHLIYKIYILILNNNQSTVPLFLLTLLTKSII